MFRLFSTSLRSKAIFPQQRIGSLGKTGGEERQMGNDRREREQEEKHYLGKYS